MQKFSELELEMMLLYKKMGWIVVYLSARMQKG